MLLHLLPRDNLPGLLQQHYQNLEGLFLQSNPGTLLAQFTRLYIHFKYAKPNETEIVRRLHVDCPLNERSIALSETGSKPEKSCKICVLFCL
jgi:hypothetical protein